MAKNVDDLQINVTVNGTAQIKETVTATENLDNATKKVGQSMGQQTQNIRNVAYQIQDLSVQIAGGTSAFIALGQQVPQLLGSFGTMGIIIGAVAAVAIPVLQQALKVAGVDMRNLKERTDDLTTSVKNLKDAQQQNLPTLEGLRASYGSLSEETKRFFDINEQLKQQKVYSDLSTAITQLKKDFGFMNQEIDLTTESSRAMGEAQMGAAINNAWLSVKAYLLGLTAEQAREVAKQIKNIDASDPKKSAETINNILEYLKKLGPEADGFRRKFEETYLPLTKINEAIIEQERNLKAAAQEATALSAKLMNMQAGSIVSAGNARRDFNQITAIGIESAEKIKEYTLQAQEKTKKDQVDRSAEIAAFNNKTNAERISAEKDFYKTQQESFYGQQLSNEVKQRGLDLQSKLNGLQMGQVEAINYKSILEESSLKNIHDQVEATKAIEELVRKNVITRQRANLLEEQAAGIRKQADDNAEQAAIKIGLENQRSIRLQVEGMTLSNNERSRSLDLEQKIFGLSSNTQAASRKELEIQAQQLRTIRDITNNNRLSEEEKAQAIASVNEEYKQGLKLVEQELIFRNELDKNFKAGAQDRAKQIAESFTPFKTAGMMVDAVWSDMSSSLDKFVETGKLSFGDLARSIIMDLEKIALKSAVIGLFKSFGLGDIFSLPGRAAGGPVSSNTPYMVGEQGPELFIPNASGSIVPNSRLGGGSTTIINNISAVDAKSVAQLFAENRMTLFGNVEQARRELPMRTR